MLTNCRFGLTKSQSPRRPLSSQFLFPKYSHDNLGLIQSPGNVYHGGVMTRGTIFRRQESRDRRPMSSTSKNNLFRQMAIKAKKERQSAAKNNIDRKNIDIQEEYYYSNKNKQNNSKMLNINTQRLKPTLKGRQGSSSKSKQRYIVNSGQKKTDREGIKIRFNRVEQKKKEEEIQYVRTSDGNFQVGSRVKDSLDMTPDL